MSVSQAILATLIFVCQLLVVYTQQMQDCCVEVVYMYGGFCNVVAKVVRAAMHVSSLYAATGKE